MSEETSGQYAIVELMGHKVVAGFVQKSEMLGKPMLRIDVPATDKYPEYTQFYGETAIYCVTFVSEEVARRAAQSYQVNPVSVYVPDLVTKEQMDAEVKRWRDEARRLRALPAPPAPAEDEEAGTVGMGLPCSRCGYTGGVTDDDVIV